MHNFLFLILFWSTSLLAGLIQAPSVPVSFVQNASGISWKMISSEHFEVIYPDGFAEDAKLVLATLDSVYEEASSSLKIEPRKIPIILQPHTLVSNGFVTLAPRRSEFFTTPLMGPGVGQTEWLRTLALHEFRHVVQFEKSQHGFARALYIILGEVGSAIAMGLTIPSWYFEGDAVGIETALSLGGRGRLPLFDRDLRALVLDGQEWSYDQMFFGSFKRYRPNHYVLGFFLTTFIRKKFGSDILEQIHWDTMERAYNPLAFYWACEKYTKLTIDELYREMMAELSQQWGIEPRDNKITLKKNEADWINYSYPVRSEGKVFAFKQSLSKILQFVEMGEVDKVLWTPTPLVQDFPFKARKGKIAYSQTLLHPRFGNKDFSQVLVRDLATQKIVFEKSQTKWTLPVLNHQADRLAYVSWTEDGKVQIGIWDLTTNTEVWSMPWSRQEAIMGLDWTEDAQSLILLHRSGAYAHHFVRIDLLSKQTHQLLSTETSPWSYPVVYQNQIYFQSPQTGVDNIFRFNLDSLEVQQVTHEPLGAYHPHLDSEGLAYVSYTAEGQKIKSKPWPLELYSTSTPTHSFAQDITSLEAKGDVLQATQMKDIKEKDYHQLSHSFNPHSWFLMAPPFSATMNAEIRSTNLLNTLNIGAGAQWDLNERVPQMYAFTQWQYLWPVFDFKMGYGNRRLDGDVWEEGASSLGVTLPYTSLYGAFTHSSRLRLGGELLHAAGRSSTSNVVLKDDSLAGVSTEWSSSILHRQALRDVLPPWGAQLRVRAQSLKDIEKPGLTTHQAYFSGQLYSTPIFNHHHFYLESSYQENSANGYRLPSFQLFPRGVSNVFLEKSTKQSLNYLLPVAYPEWNAGEWFYVKRLSLNLFYDHLEGTRLNRNLTFESQGIELWVDSHFFRNSFNIQWGLRYSRPKLEEESVELFLNTGVASF